jgi:protease-4
LGNPDKPLTAEERELYMRDINIIYENFIKTVSENRSLPLERVRAIADGSTVLGETAKTLGLIDQIGGMPEVEAYLKEIVGDAPEYCWD